VDFFIGYIKNVFNKKKVDGQYHQRGDKKVKTSTGFFIEFDHGFDPPQRLEILKERRNVLKLSIQSCPQAVLYEFRRFL